MFLLLVAGASSLMSGDLQEGRTLFGFVLVTLGLTKARPNGRSRVLSQ